MIAPHSEVVFASAGSGKTYELTSRFLRLFAQGEDPATLLASTFTRTAAGEILQRIVTRLADATTSDVHRDELSLATGLTLSAEQCAELLDRLLNNLHRINIGTIDSLFARLAGAFAMELGVAPAWRIADTEIDLELRERALDKTLADHGPADAALLIEMLLASEGRSIREQILKLISEALDGVREVGPGSEAWESLRPRSSPLDETQLADAITVLEKMAIPLTKGGTPSMGWQRARDAMLAQARASEWDAIIGSTLADIVLQGNDAYSRVPAGKAQRDSLEAVVNHAASEELWRHYRRSLARRDLVLRFDGHYQQIKAHEGLLQFDDLPRMLDEAHVLGDLDELYFRLDARTRHVLLDEFQDTSIFQFRLLKPILDEILSQSDGRSVFVVGDDKQSLFGWRNAEPELLAQLPGLWENLSKRTLAKSWRSSQIVLDAVNDVFGSLETNGAVADEPAALSWRQRFERHVAAKDLKGRVRLIESRPLEGEKKPDASLRIACERVAAIHEQHPNASIAIIVRRNKTIREMVSRLRDLGLEASEEGGSPLTDCAPVVAALSLIQLADHPGDTASLYHVATSPLGDCVGLRDHEDLDRARQIAKETRSKINASGLARFLARLGDSLLSQMETGESERFDRLIDLAQEFDAGGWTRLDRFVEVVRNRRIESPSTGSIRVMTIHKSKGLEFDAVILAELDEKIEPRPGGILIQRDDPLGAPRRACVWASEPLRVVDDRLEEVFQAARKHHLEEGLSQLYVAMTRARYCLEMIVQQSPRTSELSHAKILRAALAQSNEESEDPMTLFDIGDDNWMSETPATTIVEPELYPLALRERDRPLASRLARRAASADSDRVRVRDRLQLGESFARRRGSLIHRWCEAIGWLDQATPTDAELLAIARDDNFEESFATRCLGEFRRSLQEPPIQCLFSHAPPKSELWRERPFAVRLSSGTSDRLVTGRFDRVVILRAQGAPEGAHVIDFKTDTLDEGSLDMNPIDGLLERYAPQMEAYRTAAAILLDIPESSVRCSLALLAAGKVVEVPHTAPNEEQP